MPFARICLSCSKSVNVWWLLPLVLNLALLYSDPLMNVLPHLFSYLWTSIHPLKSIAGSRILSFVLVNRAFKAFTQISFYNDKKLLWWVAEDSFFVQCDDTYDINSNHLDSARCFFLCRVSLPRWYLMVIADFKRKSVDMDDTLVSKAVVGFYRIFFPHRYSSF